ncbi:hypothetical protein NYQ10_03505 [Flavobacterium johnsoniae]|uniref:hypothetical protein n=1 Tax=Flavobacterium johnsoniae TaxID=986 RepID=UPI0025AFA600|nr:hypothetical protein [Flavobacterium johnsoniae]WJS95522.1 hypothetical protein NYQ10_03505 [Flavobacterium johnsoniae]
MRLYFIFFFLIIFKSFGQEVSEINKALGISDSLEYQQEIRIYKNSIGNNTVIFRMYKEKNNWLGEISYYDSRLKQITKINGIVFPKEKIGKLKPVDPELIWLKILMTNVEFLPNIKDISYKFGTPKIEFEKGEPTIVTKKRLVVDGEGYDVYIRNRKTKNSFYFDNPKTYLKYYPTVDELISYNELLSVLEKEFSF